MDGFLPFFLIIFVGVFLSIIGRRLHVPWVVGLIVLGMIVGPHGLDLLTVDPTLTLIGEIGLMFLMFMAGLETRLSTFKKYRHDIAVHSLLHILVPLAVGLVIGLALALPLLEGVVLGIILVSSSIAIIVPALEAERVLHMKVGRIIVGSTVIVDILSLITLTFLIETVEQGRDVSLAPYALMVVAVVGLRWLLPKLERLLAQGADKSNNEQELHAVVLILLGTALLFSVLGLHPIIGGFFAGMILAETIRSKKLLSKLHALGYGIFIPIFFVLVGTEVSFENMLGAQGVTFLTAVLLVGTVASKYFAGYVGGRFDGFSRAESRLMGVAGIPRLSTTLVAVFAAAEFNVLSAELASALVLTSMLTTLSTPFFLRRAAARVRAAG